MIARIKNEAKLRIERYEKGLSMVNPANPLIVQSDKSVLLEVDNPLYEDARDSQESRVCAHVSSHTP